MILSTLTDVLWRDQVTSNGLQNLHTDCLVNREYLKVKLNTWITIDYLTCFLDQFKSVASSVLIDTSLLLSSAKKLKIMKEGVAVCLLGNKKNTWNQFLMVSQISRLDIIFHIQSCLPMCFSCSTNLLVNIPFSLPQQSSPVVLYPSSSLVVCRRDSNDTASAAGLK